MIKAECDYSACDSSSGIREYGGDIPFNWISVKRNVQLMGQRGEFIFCDWECCAWWIAEDRVNDGHS